MYIEKIKEVMEKSQETDRESLADALNKVTDYINFLTQEGARSIRARVTLDQQDFVEWQNRDQHMRNRYHDDACRGIDAINQIAKRNHMRPVFPGFELEAPERSSQTMNQGVKFSSNNHAQVTEFGAVLNNEFYHEGAYELEKDLMSTIVMDQQILYEPLTAQTAMQKAEQYADAHTRLNLEDILDKAMADEIRLTCYDGMQANIYTGQDNLLGVASRTNSGHLFSTDCALKLKELNSLTLQGNQSYFDKDGGGYDVPVSVLEEIISAHGGVKEYREIDLTHEKELLQQASPNFECSKTDTGLAISPKDNPDLIVHFDAEKSDITYYQNDTRITGSQFRKQISDSLQQHLTDLTHSYNQHHKQYEH